MFRPIQDVQIAPNFRLAYEPPPATASNAALPGGIGMSHLILKAVLAAGESAGRPIRLAQAGR